MDNEKLINKYNKKEDPALWELIETKHKLGRRGITANEMNENAKAILHDFRERQKKYSQVSDTNKIYKSR